MSKYTPEQVIYAADLEQARYDGDLIISGYLRDYASLLRERESAKAVVTHAVTTKAMLAYNVACHSEGDPRNAHAGGMQAALEAVAPMLAKAEAHDLVAFRCRERNGMGIWRYIEYDTRSPDSYELRECEIQNVYASSFNPDGMTLVEKEDANSYCRILSLLGMEEEGDPVDWVQKMLASARVPESLEVAGYVDPDQVRSTQQAGGSVGIGSFSSRYGRTVPVYWDGAAAPKPEEK